MTSCLYECTVMHHRILPKRHRFAYRLFMFCLDLDEIDAIVKRSWLIRRNAPGIFSFYDNDHIQRGAENVKGNIERVVRAHGVSGPIGRIYLITHLRSFGYVFNPVSFFFCFDDEGKPLCVVVEVGNTFGEKKAYVAGPEHIAGNTFRRTEQKHFYISPFIDLDAFMDFRLSIPENGLSIRIDDLQGGKRLLVTTLNGRRRPLTNTRLLMYTLLFPFVTLQVIAKIHWQALLLLLKGLPFHRKEAHPHLQRNIEYADH